MEGISGAKSDLLPRPSHSPSLLCLLFSFFIDLSDSTKELDSEALFVCSLISIHGSGERILAYLEE